MRTETKARILELIQDAGGMRPVELVDELGITPQAIHRHLRDLLTVGRLERRGRGPKTSYCIAGAPQLDAARRWCGVLSEPGESPRETVCKTRDVFTARLGRLGSLAGAELDENELALLISAVGEVGNNCFDHNLGNWRDVPGCWFEVQTTGGRLWICIADRGQGVLRTLSRADPTLRDEQTALVAAFEKTISGRAPESRGNGLKFVRNIVVASALRGLACRSGAGLVAYGPLGGECLEEAGRFPSQPGGTVTVILWSLR